MLRDIVMMKMKGLQCRFLYAQLSYYANVWYRAMSDLNYG